MAPHHYLDLPDPRTHIRILRLSAGEESSSLKAALETFAIRDKPQYEALSYCWGSEQKSHELLLRDQGEEYLLPITENLSLALKRMRYVAQDRVLWTDAVCINQADDKEKRHQVRIMNKLYAAATKVLVYLGESDPSLPQAVKLLQRIHKAGSEGSNVQLDALQWIKYSKLPSVLESWKWEPLKAFFRRPWFRRKWTIQECALASALDFHCGVWMCDWDWMSLVIEMIYNKGLAVQDYTLSANEHDARQLQQGLSQINAIRLYKQGRQDGKNYPFMDLAYHFSVSEATDMRDHLFALLGVAADSEDKQLDPEYGSSTTIQNCLRYAYYYLHRYQNLEVLYRAGLAGHALVAPSWIPNWYGGHQTFGLGSNEGVWNPLLRPKHLHVARGTSVSLNSSPNSVVLGLHGVVIDVIRDLASEHLVTTQDAWRSKDLILTHRRQHLLVSDQIIHKLQSYPTGEALEDVQWRTLICNTTRNGTIPNDEFKDVYRAWRRGTLIVSPLDQLRADFESAQPFDRVFGAWNADKIFGLTGAGYVGMFPYHSKKDDVVAILYGGEFPFVLRPFKGSHPPTYQLVGQCYIHGIMEEGQLDLKTWKSHEQEIRLA